MQLQVFEIDQLNWTGVVWTEKWMHICERIGSVFDFVHFLYGLISRQVFLIFPYLHVLYNIIIILGLHLFALFYWLISKQLQVWLKCLNEKFETEFPLIINYKSLLPTILICVALKWFSVIKERNYPSVNRPKLCVLHTIFKLNFEYYINFYVN